MQRELERRVARHPAQDRARRLVLAVVAAEVARLVVDHALELRRNRDPALLHQLRDELRVVHDLEAAAERRELVAQRIERVGVGGHDARRAHLVQRLRKCLRELLEQHFVADAANALAGGPLARAQDAEAHAGGLEHRDQRLRDALAPRIVRCGRADVVEVVEARQLFLARHDRHAEVPRPRLRAARRGSPTDCPAPRTPRRWASATPGTRRP